MPNTNTFFIILFATLALSAANTLYSDDIARKVLISEPFAMPPEASDVGWTGMLDHFIPEGAENKRMLRLRGNTQRSDTSWLAAPAQIFHGEWNYIIDIRGEPSNTNRVDLVLMSDSDDLKSPFNGYLIKAGDNGSNDVFRLMRVDSGTLVPLISGTLPISGGGTFKIRLERNPVGQWTMYAAKLDDAFTLQGVVSDARYGNLGFTGFRMIYTRTRNSDYAIGPITIAKNPPHVLQVQSIEPRRLIVDFDSDLASTSKPTLFMDGGPWAASSTVAGNEVIFELADQIPPGEYEAQIRGLSTVDGLFEDVAVSISFSIDVDVSPGDVVINEYMYHPPIDISQFVELVNTTEHPVNLKGWELRDLGTGNRVITTSDMWLPPNGYLVLTPDSTSVSTYYSAPNVRSMARFPLLNRGSKDSIILRNTAGITIDSVGYSPKPAGDGVSIERVSLQAPSWAPTNWRPSVHRRGATPGEPNSVPPEEPSDPQLSLVLIEDEYNLTLHFNAEIVPSSISELSINGLSTSDFGCNSEDWKQVNCKFVLKLPIDDDIVSQLVIGKLNTALGSNVTNISSPISFHPYIGDILINEIMFNPLQVRYDGGTDQSQYIELFNTRGHHVYTGGLSFFTKSMTGLSSTSIASFESETNKLNPKALAVIHADTSTTPQSRLATFFGLVDTVSYLRANRSTLGLNTTSGSIWIQYRGTTLDSVRFDAQYHYPSVRDHRGVSLERVSTARASTDPKNWGSHGGILGGSPGKANSISKILEKQPNVGIDVYPNPFSPDNDGFEDIAHIRIQFEDPGWLLNVTIFDRHGRKVRTLADGERVGTAADIPWNGLDDSNRRAFSGFYVALVEAWHMERRTAKTYRHILGLIHQPGAGTTFK